MFGEGHLWWKKSPEGTGGEHYQLATRYLNTSFLKGGWWSVVPCDPRSIAQSCRHQVSLQWRFKWGSGGGRVELHLKSWSAGVGGLWRLCEGL